MASFNNITVLGSLGRDPEIRYAQSGTAIANFSLAVDCGYGDNKTTSWLKIVCFGKVAENVAQYLKKGSKCLVNGEIKTGDYEKDGRKVYTFEIISKSVQFLGGGNSEVSQQSTVDAKKNSKNVDINSIDEIDDDNIPF